MHRKTLLISLSIHGALIMLLSFNFSHKQEKPIIIAQLMFKPSHKQATTARNTLSSHKTSTKTSISKKKLIKDNPQNMKMLASLSDQFALETKDFAPKEDISISVNNYLDYVYAVIKKYFSIPPHIDEVNGKHLKMSLNLYIAKDGVISNIATLSKSNDEHFDKAVMESIHKIGSFNAPPLDLQYILENKGIVVDLCPFRCE